MVLTQTGIQKKECSACRRWPQGWMVGMGVAWVDYSRLREHVPGGAAA